MDTLPTAATTAATSERGARLQGWAMIIVLVVGFGLGIAVLCGPGSQRRLAAVMTLDALFAGRTAAAVNHAMAHDLPGGGLLQAAGGVLRWRLFGSGGPQVMVGCGDWLYLTEELRPWPGAAASMQLRAAALHRIAAKLAAQGIAVEIVLVPDKARIAAAERCGTPYSAQSQARFARFAGLLEGLAVVDANTALSAAATPVFYRTDTHWNQAGAAVVARAVAKAVSLTPAAAFRTDAGPEAARVGDLLHLMSLDAVPDLALKLRPIPDREAPETTVRTDTPAETGGLLDDAPVPRVVLLGSSFSLNGNFYGRLQEALGVAVGQFAEAGGGFAGSARDYFRSPAFRETPPKLVIWEIPERVVDQPIGREEAAFLRDWARD